MLLYFKMTEATHELENLHLLHIHQMPVPGFEYYFLCSNSSGLVFGFAVNRHRKEPFWCHSWQVAYQSMSGGDNS